MTNPVSGERQVDGQRKMGFWSKLARLLAGQWAVMARSVRCGCPGRYSAWSLFRHGVTRRRLAAGVADARSQGRL